MRLLTAGDDAPRIARVPDQIITGDGREFVLIPQLGRYALNQTGTWGSPVMPGK